jgi:hypothetical protein
MDEADRVARSDLVQICKAQPSGLQQKHTISKEQSETPVLNVRVVQVDTQEPTLQSRGIEPLDLHSLVDLP